jgi:hypothetical protein
MCIIVSVLIFVAALIIAEKRNKRLTDEGKIIDREWKFWEKAEIFTLIGGEYEKVGNLIKTADYSECPVTLYPNYENKKVFLFKSGEDWEARLIFLGENEGKSKYRFEFIKWKTRNGIPKNTSTMNMIETTIEKIFLGLDSKTVVETEKIKIKTR